MLYSSQSSRIIAAPAFTLALDDHTAAILVEDKLASLLLLALAFLALFTE